MHRYEELVRREYEARAQRDFGSLAEIFADDIVWYVPGRSAIAGTYRGKDSVLEYSRKRQEMVKGTFDITVEDILVSNERALVVAKASAERSGKRHDWRAHGLYRFRDDKIAECCVLPEDQNDIWS